MKPLIEFKYEEIKNRSNILFELATPDEIDKLGRTATRRSSSDEARFTDEIHLEEVGAYVLHAQDQGCQVSGKLHIAHPVVQ